MDTPIVFKGRVGTGLFRDFSFPVRARAWADVVGPAVTEAIRREAPISSGRDAGGLRRSVDFSAHVTRNRVFLDFHVNSPVAEFIIKGTQPHEIRPRNKNALHWSDGHSEFFAKVVHHPGTKPNDFLTRAVEYMTPWMRETFRMAVTEGL
ncbi:hypothetical protein [Streptomyces sp. NPDC093261]|uniref:hypothetical protein n=1 Tax=Streptomyces sp. NPDC093261 TaxID=3366037 RepID=UPI003821D201